MQSSNPKAIRVPDNKVRIYCILWPGFTTYAPFALVQAISQVQAFDPIPVASTAKYFETPGQHMQVRMWSSLWERDWKGSMRFEDKPFDGAGSTSTSNR